MLKNLQQRQKKLVQKRAIHETAEATGDLIGNKNPDRITGVSKISTKEFHSKEFSSNETNNKIPKERYISPHEKQQIIDELRLI